MFRSIFNAGGSNCSKMSLYLRKLNSSEFINDLRCIGLEMRGYMNRLIDKNHRQFLVACLVSYTEIEDGLFHTVLNSAYVQFHRLLARRTRINVSQRYFRFGRFVFLMNSKDFSGKDQHTEARLLDQFGILRELITADEVQTKNESFSDSVFLDGMKRDFIAEFGGSEEYCIAMFSYFLPCTQPGHMCAELVRNYADLTGTKVIVSYEMPFKTTDAAASLTSMNESDNVILIHSEERNYEINVKHKYNPHHPMQIRYPNDRYFEHEGNVYQANRYENFYFNYYFFFFRTMYRNWI